MLLDENDNLTVDKMASFFRDNNLFINPDQTSIVGRNWKWDDLFDNVRPGYYCGQVHDPVSEGEEKGSHSTLFLRWADCRPIDPPIFAPNGDLIKVQCSPKNTNPNEDFIVEVLDSEGNGTGKEINLGCQALYYAAGGNQNGGRVHIDLFNLFNLTDYPEYCETQFNYEVDGDYPDKDMFWYSSYAGMKDPNFVDNGFGITEPVSWTIIANHYNYNYQLPISQIDPSGHVFIAGIQGNNDLLHFIQYGIWKDIRWETSFNLGTSTVPYSGVLRFNKQQMAIDYYGNLFMVANTENGGTLIKYNRDGELEWSKNLEKTLGVQFAPLALAVNSYGDSLISGDAIGNKGTNNILLVSINPDGQPNWMTTGADSDQQSYASAIIVNTDDDIYQSGVVSDSGGKKFMVSKYNIDGELEWQNLFGHPEMNSASNPQMIANGKGETFLAGFVSKSLKEKDKKGLAVIKYEPNGATSWYRFYYPDQAEISHDWPVAVGLDFADNIFIMATISRTEELTGYLLLKYNSDGELVWSKIYDHNPRMYDQATAMAVTGAGYAYLTGVTEHEIDGNNDMVTIKYDPEGNLVWSKVFDGGGTSGEGDMPGTIDVDFGGNIVVTGIIENDEGYHWIIHRYNNDHWWRENGCSGCLIDNNCFATGELNPNNPCQYCDSYLDSWRWTVVGDGISCDDGSYCNGDDYCYEGACVHEGDPCGDNGVFCDGEESCDEENDECASSGNPCPNNGLFCDGEEFCDEEAQSCDTTGFPCAEDEECLEDTDECEPLTDDDSVDDDTTGDDDDDDCGGCGNNESDWIKRILDRP